MDSYLWYHLWALPMIWDLVDPMQTLNMDDIHSYYILNPDAFVHPTNTSDHVSDHLVHRVPAGAHPHLH